MRTLPIKNNISITKYRFQKKHTSHMPHNSHLTPYTLPFSIPAFQLSPVLHSVVTQARLATEEAFLFSSFSLFSLSAFQLFSFSDFSAFQLFSFSAFHLFSLPSPIFSRCHACLPFKMHRKITLIPKSNLITNFST